MTIVVHRALALSSRTRGRLSILVKWRNSRFLPEFGEFEETCLCRMCWSVRNFTMKCNLTKESKWEFGFQLYGKFQPGCGISHRVFNYWLWNFTLFIVKELFHTIHCGRNSVSRLEFAQIEVDLDSISLNYESATNSVWNNGFRTVFARWYVNVSIS